MVANTFKVPVKAVVVAATITAALSAVVASSRPVDYVDTRIGTGGLGFGIGSINPGAQVPFGALRLGARA